MKFKFLFFLLLINTYLFAGEWNWQNPKPQGNTLWKIAFYNEWYGYAVGDYGTIMFTNDKGISWEIQYEGVTDNLRSISVQDSVTAWIAGDNGIILYTFNGGYNWIDQTSYPQNGLNSIFFFDKMNGWASGDSKTLLKTTNGGNIWTKIQIMSVPQTISINSIYFTSLTNGWATCSNGNILRTTDGGNSWSIQYNTSEAGFAIKFLNSTTGFVVGINGSIYRTTNSGTNWTKIISNTTQGLTDIFFATSAEYLISGHNGTILRSTNSGATWLNESISTYAAVFGITRVLNTTLVVGEYGLLGYKTGTTPWFFHNNGINKSINWITFSDYLKGFAVGQYGKIARTKNGGKTWEDINNGITGDSFYGAELIDSNYVWAVGDGGVILHSSNGGNSWIQQSTGTFNSLLSISFINRTRGWAVGDVGEFFYTTNGGANWIKKLTGWNQIFFGVKFKDINNGWIVGDGGLILRTTNGGGNWFSQTSNTLEAIFYVDFFDVNNGYCAGTNGLVLKTTNGGGNWQKLTTGTTKNIYIASGVSHNSVWAIGDSGLVLRSTNGGANWITEFPKTGYDLFGLKVISDSKAWICGDNGTILSHDTLFSLSPISVYFTNGWNLISNPILRSSGTDSAKLLFPGLLDDYVYDYTSTGYSVQQVLVNGKGYWGKFGSDGSNTISGTYISADTIEITEGWNLIGSISYYVSTASITTIPAGIISSLWWGYSDGYREAYHIEPGKAYWIKSNTTGQILMLSSGGFQVASQFSSQVSNYFAGFNTLTFSDKVGRSQTLYFGNKTEEDFYPDKYELPPTPSSDVFDVRFVTKGKGYIAQVFDTAGTKSDEILINIQGVRYPLNISWKVDYKTSNSDDNYGYVFQLTDDNNDIIFNPITLSGNGNLKIDDNYVTNLVLKLAKGQNSPTEFLLSQNYPNPFNPATVINYQLPQDEYVTLKIFDICGREVASLVNEVKKMGRYKVEVDASNLASGIYFYRIIAGTYNKTMKMIVLR